jgi:peptide/nickel transport system ATP-binding protein
MQMKETILEICNLKTYFNIREGKVKAVDGISLKLFKGETLGLVGESGCGKSVTGLSIIRLLDEPPAEIHGGKILFSGEDLLSLNKSEIRKFRGKDISMIFQEPMTSLNPVMPIGKQIGEIIKQHDKTYTDKTEKRIVELLDMVEIPSADRLVKQYPHQISGGMRQRVMIAMALACSPKVLIADEPTTALDVTTQAQILELLRELQRNLGTSILLISHNLGVIAEMATDVAVMYASKIVETGEVSAIFERAIHPYTQGLLLSIPFINDSQNRLRLKEIPGGVPNLYNLPKGCNFYDRCSKRSENCQINDPLLKRIEKNHYVSCLNV